MLIAIRNFLIAIWKISHSLIISGTDHFGSKSLNYHYHTHRHIANSSMVLYPDAKPMDIPFTSVFFYHLVFYCCFPQF